MANAADVERMIAIQLRAELARAVQLTAEETTLRFREFLKGMEFGNKTDLTRVHRQIAGEMKEAVRAEYDARVESIKGAPRPGAPGRYSGGLRKVINRSTLARGTAEGIDFIDVGAFDREAKHWYRINFGAGSIAGPQPAPYNIRLLGQTLFNVPFGSGPSAPFILPKGFFIHAAGAPTAVKPMATYRGAQTGRAFVPSSKSPYTPTVTAGIRGRHFLDVGMEVAQREIPIQYENLLNEWVQRGGRRAKAIAQVRTT